MLRLKFREKFVLYVTKEGVGDRLGQVTEPAVAKRGVVCEALDGEEERIDNTPPKSLVPQTVRQNIFPAGGGNKISLDDKLFRSIYQLIHASSICRVRTLNP